MSRRLAGLDALRGVAALSVVLFHYTTRYDLKYGHAQPPGFSVPWGYLGVDLFFMISGFVILMSLDRTRSAMDFVVSRFSRLFPAFWLAVLLTYIVLTLWPLPDKHITVGDLLLNFTMVPGLLNAHLVDGAYWTLEVELLFYALMLGLYRAGLLNRLPQVLAAWLMLSAVASLAQQQGHEMSYLIGHLLLLPYIGWFGLGMVLYRLHDDSAQRSRYRWLWAACVLLLAFTASPEERVSHLVVALGGSALIAGVQRGGLALLAHPVLVFLGTVSYPLYLLHENIGFVLLRAAEAHGVPTDLAIAATATALVALAWLCTRGVEQPALRWIRRRWAARRGSGGLAGGTV